MDDLLTLLKGLSTGYARDLQDDRQAILDTGPLVRGAVSAVRLALPHVVFDRVDASRGVRWINATRMLPRRSCEGHPFREPTRRRGNWCTMHANGNVTLASVDVKAARAIHSAFDESVLAVIDPRAAVLAKRASAGQRLSASMSSLRGSALCRYGAWLQRVERSVARGASSRD